MAVEHEIERLVVRLMGDASSYQRMIRQAQKTVPVYQRIGKQVGILGQKLRTIGKSASLYITTPLAAIGSLSVQAFSRFDRAMVESTSIMQVTEAQTEQMRDLALSLSKEAPQGPEELARSYYYLASAGKNAEQSMALLPKVAAFATAGAFDMAQATDLLTDAQSALGLTSKNVIQDQKNLVRVSDVLVKANTLANASVEQFSTALTSKTGAALKAFGKDVEEGVAVLAAFADQGVKAELAGNQLDRVIRLLSKSSMDNAAAHERLGFRVFDETGKMRNLGDIIANLEDILAGMSDQTKVATLDMMGFEARVQQAILPLLGTSDNINRYERELRNAGGTTRDVAEKQMKSFSNQMKLLKNEVSLAAIKIGESLAPKVAVLGGAIKKATGWFTSLNDSTKSIIVNVGLLAAGIGPLIYVVGALSTAFSILLAHPVVAALVGITAATIALNIAMNELGRPTVEVSDAYARARKEGDKVRKSQLEQVDVLQALAEKQSLSTKEMDAAEKIVNGLKASYGDLGITVDRTTGSIVGVGDAQKRLTEIMREQRIQQLKMEWREAQAAAEEYSQAAIDIDRGWSRWLMTATAREAEMRGLNEKSAEYADRMREITRELQNLQETQDVGRGLLTGEGSATEAASDQLKNSIREAAEQAAALDQAAERFAEQAKTPWQRVKEEIAMLNKVMAAGKISYEEYTRIFEQLEEELKATQSQSEKLTDAEKKHEEAVQRGQAIYERFMTPLEKYKKAVDDLKDLKALGAFKDHPEAFKRAMAAAKKELDEAQDKAKLKVEVDTSGLRALRRGTTEAVNQIEKYKQQLLEWSKAEGKGQGGAGGMGGPGGAGGIPPKDLEDAKRRAKEAADKIAERLADERANRMPTADEARRRIMGGLGGMAPISEAEKAIYEMGHDPTKPLMPQYIEGVREEARQMEEAKQELEEAMASFNKPPEKPAAMPTADEVRDRLRQTLEEKPRMPTADTDQGGGQSTARPMDLSQLSEYLRDIRDNTRRTADKTDLEDVLEPANLG